MNFENGIHNSGIHSPKSITLLQEGASRGNDNMSLAKHDGKCTLRQGSCKNDSYISRATSVSTGKSKAPWLSTFLQKSARYEDYLAEQEAFNIRNTNQITTSQVTSASGTGAAQYAQMRRFASRPLFARNTGTTRTPFSWEWTLDEILAADKWLHEKYASSSAHRNSVRGQAGDVSGSNSNLTHFPSHVLERGDSHGMLHGTSQNIRGLEILAQNTINMLNTADGNNGHRSSTLPRTLKNLFAVGKKKTQSTCSLPDNSRMEVISRFLAAEG